ncbi:DinB family protein [Prauserella cavernicola]|uniref:DinB family protein n=1 Tax=Prauserella cavernicola TaxID=2800127 RepID=A0A934V3X7_9PSEU|nr:DinB family protein [Prauserella cavernicola]MBK1787766.1 DinB family protein [Prauserella cavernicola]
MTAPDPKDTLHRYLQAGREAMLWKLDGLSEYAARRPLTPTGTNLLGLVKHLTGCEAGYFGDTFGRPLLDTLPWLRDLDNADADPNVDMWARADESRAEIVGRYQQVCEHADTTIRELALDSAGLVPHWPSDRANTTLHHILVHMTAETHRHAGHADIVRELLDGAVGRHPGDGSIAPGDQWREHRDRVERAAREAAGGDAP